MTRMSMFLASLCLASITCAATEPQGSAFSGAPVQLAARQTEDGKAGTNKAGTNKAGTNKAGTNKASASKAGTNKAGMNKAGTNKADTNRMAARVAWVHGIPGEVSADGIACEVMALTPPQPNSRRLAVTFVGEPRLQHALARLAGEKSRLTKLTLVIRHDRQSTKSDIYHLRDVIVESHESANGEQAAVLSYGGVEVISALTGNPGPPDGAPAVASDGRNKGWVHGLTGRGERVPVEIEVEDVIPPKNNGKLVLHLRASPESPGVPWLGTRTTRIPYVILVLPERRRGAYVEYKLWDASVVAAERSRDPSGFVEWEVALESLMIECMTGESNDR